jgi:hypothetical protein
MPVPIPRSRTVVMDGVCGSNDGHGVCGRVYTGLCVYLYIYTLYMSIYNRERERERARERTKNLPNLVKPPTQHSSADRQEEQASSRRNPFRVLKVKYENYCRENSHSLCLFLESEREQGEGENRERKSHRKEVAPRRSKTRPHCALDGACRAAHASLSSRSTPQGKVHL